MNHEYWYLSRAAGLTAYILIFGSVALGVSITTRISKRWRNLIFDLHRFTTILALAFTFLHVLILLGDSYFSFSIWQIVIPFASPYRSWQTAAGAASLYVLVLLVASFYARRLIGYRAWRAIHFATFVMFAGVALHGITAGSDTETSWARLLYVATLGGVFALVMYRVAHRIPAGGSVRTVRLAAAVTTTIAGLLLLFATGLLVPSANSATSAVVPIATGADTTGGGAPTSAVVAHPFLPAFEASLAGTYQEMRDASTTSLVVDGTMSESLPSRLHVSLVQRYGVPPQDNESSEAAPDDEAGEAKPQNYIVANEARLADIGDASPLCVGSLDELRSGVMRITCAGKGPYDGIRMSVASRLTTGPDGTLTGAVSGSMVRVD